MYSKHENMQKQLIIIQFFLLAVIGLRAQSVDQFISSLGKSDYLTIESYLDNKLDLCVRDQQRFVSRSEAMNTIRNFFTNHTPKSIEPIHQGGSRQLGRNYKLAKLTTTNGVFRVFIYTENEGNKVVVKELRFEVF